MDPREKHHFARLLAGSADPSRLEKEAVLAAVLDRVRPPKAPRRAWGWAGGAAAAVLCSLALVLWSPWAGQGDSISLGGPVDEVALGSSPELGTFAARGNVQDPSFTVDCLQADRAVPCSPGAQLVFDVDPAKHRYFAAFVRLSADEVMWAFPRRPIETSVELPARKLIDQAIVLPLDMRPGRYPVTGIFSKEPLSREQVREHVRAGTNDDAQLFILTRELEIR